MLKSKKLTKALSLIITMVMVLGYFSSFGYAQDTGVSTSKVDLHEVASSKITAEVKEDLEKEDLIEVLIYLRDQVDTERVAYQTRKAVSSLYTPYKTKQEIRKAVVEALRDTAEYTQSSLLEYLEQEEDRGNVVEFTSYKVVNMIYAKATKEVIENISYRQEVEKIYKNKTHTLDIPKMEREIEPSAEGVEWNVERVKADQAWELGFDGTGVVVANIDSGVDWTHPALKNKWRGYDPSTGATNPSGNWFDPVYNATLPADSDEHGTHVMGTIVGQEEDGSNKIGMAPGARWIAARVFNAAGSTTEAILLAAADWMVAPGGDPTLAPDVVNNSWGGLDGIDDWYRDAVRNWRSAEIFPVFSAGNQRSGEPAPWPGSISCPSNYPESYAVAVTDRNDIRASFSKLGPSPYDPTLVKPNISAPGVSIRSSIPGGGYQGGWSGTSMSAPAVTGTVALLLSANASLTLEEIEEAMATTARPLTDGTYPESPNFGYGYGMVDAFEAVSTVASGTGYISGRVLVPGEDTSNPVIVHEQEIFETYAGSDIEILAEISDDVSITEVELLVKAQGRTYWMQAPMNRISGDHKVGIYKGTITYDMLQRDNVVYKIKVRDFAGEVVVTQDYRIDIKFGIVPGEYTHGFEANANGWIMDGSWEWGAPSGNSPLPLEGEQLVGTNLSGNYPNYADDWLITPPIDLRDNTLETASFRFYEWYETENNYDKGYTLVSNNYGETWTEVRPVITGVGTTWREVIVDLEGYIGSQEPVFIAFRLTSDGSVQKAGWYIDNVRLIATDNEPPAIPTNLAAEANLRGINLSWTHSPDGDLSHYNIYRSDVSGESYEKISETTANGFVDTEVNIGTTYYYVINAVDTSGNESSYTVEVFATPMEATTIFGTDFEEDDGGFVTGVTAGTANSWAWGIPSSGPNSAFSGEKLWATNLNGNYDHRTDAFIETPSIVIPEDKDGILTFNHWVDMEGSTTLWDYGQILISKDDGTTWTNITPVPGGKYGRRVQEWASEEIFLHGYNGETIKLRFFFHSDGSGAYAGWYLDDVYVMGVDYIEPEPINGEEIIYDDGTAEDALVLNGAGNGLAVRFTPSQFGKVQGANIYLWGNDWPIPGGNRLGFVIYDSNGNPAGEPIYVNNLVRGGWNLIDLSGFNFSTGSDFYISTMQDVIGDNSPGTGLDDNFSSDWSRSYLNIGGQLSPLSDEGYYDTIMIRALVDYTNNGTLKKFNIGNLTNNNKVEVNAIKEIKLLSNEAEVKKPDYVDPVSPQYKLNIEETNYQYNTISDEEVQNMPMIFVGIPVSDAVVTVLETGRSVKVDPVTGKFHMRHGIGEGFTLRAEAYGYFSKDVVVDVVEDDTTKANFVLDPKPRGTIEGRVVDRYYETPAAYATVRVVEDPKVAPVTADAEGYFTIENVYEGRYTLKVVAEGFEPGEGTVEVFGDTVSEIEIRLKRFVGYEEDIIYDDGSGENALVLNSAGYGLAVRFTPEQFGKVKGTNVYFWDTSWPTPGGNRIGFAIYETDANGVPKKVGEPIFQNIVRGEWNYIDLTSYGFSTDRDFYISTIQDAAGTSCPGTGIDEASPHGDRSYLNLDGEFVLISDEGIQGGLMIRARMEYAMDVPTITNLEPQSYTNQDRITVEGTVTADGIVNVYVNDEKVTSIETEDRQFTVEVDLPEIENSIKVTAEMNGIETEPSTPVVVIKDKEAPVLIVENPLDDANINVEVVHVIGNATDDIELAKVLINEKEVEVDEDGNFHERLIVNEGVNLITVKALDHAGNEIVIERTVTVKLEMPVLTNMEPAEDIILEQGDTLTVSFNSEPGGEGYFRLVPRFSPQGIDTGIPMIETEPGLYVGSLLLPEGYAINEGLVEFEFIDTAGNRVVDNAPGTVTVLLEGGEPPITNIINIKPDVDLSVRAGEAVEISFDGPAGGTAYFRVILPFELDGDSLGIPMVEESPGFYKAIWTVPSRVVASNLMVELVLVKTDGTKLFNMASGRITIIGDMQDLPNNTVIIGEDAYDIKFLDRNEYAQNKLREWQALGKRVFIKLNANTIVDADGILVDLDVLTENIITYFNIGTIEFYQK